MRKMIGLIILVSLCVLTPCSGDCAFKLPKILRMEGEDKVKTSDSKSRFVEEPAWVAEVFDFAQKRIEANPPCWPPTKERQEALDVLDGPLHLIDAHRFKSTFEFFQNRMTKAIEEIERTKVTEGLRIWRLYNHGFVIRTPSVTIGCDLQIGWYPTETYSLPKELSLRLAKQIDLLTVSHPHGDHYNVTIRDAVLERGVPVFVDPKSFDDFPKHPLLTSPTRLDPEKVGRDLPADAWTPLLVKGVECAKYLVLPGHQNDCQNNVYLFKTKEGYTFIHSGDQCNDPDLAWLDRVGDMQALDVLITNSWTWDLPRVVNGIRPKIIITGHEMEMGHEPSHREAYWRSFQLFRETQMNGYPLCWGESLTYPR